MISVVKSSLRWTAALLLFGVAGTSALLLQAHREEEKKHYLGFTQMLSILVRPSLSISDYGEVQRILALVPHEAGLIPAVLTKEGDLLMADYSLRPLFGNTLAENTNEAPSGYQIFQSKIVDREDLSTTPAELGTVIALHSTAISSFSWLEISTFAGVLFAALAGFGVVLRSQVRRRYHEPLEKLAARLERGLAIEQSELTPELRELSRAFLKQLDGSRIELKTRQEQEKRKALQVLAQQIAQDLKLSLSALEADAGPDSVEKARRRLQAVDQHLHEKQLELS